ILQFPSQARALNDARKFIASVDINEGGVERDLALRVPHALHAETLAARVECAYQRVARELVHPDTALAARMVAHARAVERLRLAVDRDRAAHRIELLIMILGPGLIGHRSAAMLA